MAMKRDEWIQAKAWDTAQKDNVSRQAYENAYKHSYLKDAAEQWDMMHPPRKKNFVDKLLGYWID